MEKDKKTMGTDRRKAYRVTAIVSVIVLILAVIGINVIVKLLDNSFNLNIDMSQQKYYTLSDETKQLLDGLDQNVYIYTLFGTGNEDTRVVELMKNYAAYSDKVKYENVDISLNPSFTTQFDPENKGISASSLIVTNESHSLFKVYTVYELYSIDSTGTYVYSFNAETRVSSAIQYLKTGVSYGIKLLAGHSEKTEADLNELIITLNALNYEVESYNPSITATELNPEYDLLLIVSPGEDLSADDYTKVKSFLDKGGNAIFIMNYVMFDSSTGYTKIVIDDLNNFNSLLMMYGLKINKDYLIGTDSSRLYQRVTGLVPNLYQHSITNPMIENNSIPVLMDCSSISIATGEDVKAGTLLESDATVFAKQVSTAMSASYEEGDEVGPFTIAAVAQKDDSKIAVFSSGSFVLSNSDGIERASNQSLIVNTVNTLAEKSDNLDISVKSMLAGSMQTKGAEPAILIIILVLIVLAIIAVGLTVWIKRKRR